MVYKQRDIICDKINDSDIINTILKNRACGNMIELTTKDIQLLNEYKDIERASKVLMDAIDKNKKIVSVTDSDCDGITSAVITSKMLNRIGYDTLTTIINKREYGNGINDTLVKQIKELKDNNNCDIIITSDHGSSDIVRLRELKEYGIKVVVTDHHIVDKNMVPKDIDGFVNPQQDGCRYDKHVCGAVVVWSVWEYIIDKYKKIGKTIKDDNSIWGYLALATIGDNMNMSSLTNRAIVKLGLREINSSNYLLWRLLQKELDWGTIINDKHIGFNIAPLINATNRMGMPELGYELLTSTTEKEIKQKLTETIELNKKRRVYQDEMWTEALEQSKLRVKQFKYIMVIFLEKYNGIQGIIASKLVEKYGRSTIVFIRDGDKYKGSGRSDGILDLRDMLSKIKETGRGGIVKFGGHKGAVGVEITLDMASEFIKECESFIDKDRDGKHITKTFLYDKELNANDITFKTIKSIDVVRPYGIGFEEPSFRTIFKIKSLRLVGSNREHISLELIGSNNKLYRAIFMGGSNVGEFKKDDRVDVIYIPELNIFRGMVTIQLVIEHMVKQ